MHSCKRELREDKLQKNKAIYQMGLSMHIMPMQYSFGRKLREADFHVKLFGEVAALVKGVENSQ